MPELWGGRLHAAHYQRKPRGVRGELPEGYERRLSFCCAREGCRKRVKPPSARYLGRKVYVGAVVVVMAVALLGSGEAAALREQVGASARTLGRWSQWWPGAFADSALWKGASGHFMPLVDRALLPASLLERFAGPLSQRLTKLMHLIAPVTTRSGAVASARLAEARSRPAEDAGGPAAPGGLQPPATLDTQEGKRADDR